MSLGHCTSTVFVHFPPAPAPLKIPVQSLQMPLTSTSLQTALPLPAFLASPKAARRLSSPTASEAAAPRSQPCRDSFRTDSPPV